jgi:hypothetical protein
MLNTNMNETNGTSLEVPWVLYQTTMNTPTGIMAWISIVLNVLVIASFLNERKTKRVDTRIRRMKISVRLENLI